MDLPKAYIQLLDGKDKEKDTVAVMFNPSEYSVDKSNQFQSTSIPGLSAPLIQFISGNSETLTMDLFFDTYERGTDVRNDTEKLINLLKVDKDLHAPPRCRFVWGNFQFKAVIEKVTQRFTMFLADGTPVRANLNVTFKEYKTISEQLSTPPRQSADRTKTRVYQQGDSLWLLADREYGDPKEWRRIAAANDIENPRTIETGKQLKLPPVE